MPSVTRVPVVEFRSLLLPPIRVSLRAVQSLYRPQCLSNRPSTGRSPPCLTQCRSLVLYKTAIAKTVLGQHKILPFERYMIPPPGDSAHEVNLTDHKGNLIVENISLEEIYEKHIRPGQLLYLNDEIKKSVAQNIPKMKSDKIQLKSRTYCIREAETIPGNKKEPTAGKGQGAFRVTPLALSSGPQYFQLALDRSYQFIKHGSPVEFTIAIKRSPTSKEQKWKGTDDRESWPWIHEHFPHLRPDFILKQMPEGSMYSVDPVSDGRLLQFVIIKPSTMNRLPRNLTDRLFKVKESVIKHIAKGQAAQLPSGMRRELSLSGNESYSPLSSMPLKAKMTEEMQEEAKQPTEDWDSPFSRNRYAPIEPEPKPYGRTDKLTSSGKLVGFGHNSWSRGGALDPPGFKKMDRDRDGEGQSAPETRDQSRGRATDDYLDFSSGSGPRGDELSSEAYDERKSGPPQRQKQKGDKYKKVMAHLKRGRVRK